MGQINTTICIVGAGPAGAATSIFLSKLGIEHLIVDTAIFPRDKVCGDGLDMKTIRMLNHIDPSIIASEIANNSHFTASWGMRSISPKGRNRDFAFSPPKGKALEVPFFVSKRFYFDDFLLKKIDTRTATLLQGTKVTNIAKEGNNWCLKASQKDGATLEINCQMLVGADGDHSIVLKHLGYRKINRDHYAGSVRQYWTGIEGIHEKHLLEFYYPPSIPMGYFWIFPQGNGSANVGYGITSSIAAKQHLNLRQTFMEIIQKDAAIAARFAKATPVDEPEGWGIPLASARRKVVGDGWLLVGDAASMVSPNTGEGIGTGMMTGYIAAKFLQKGLKAGNFSMATIGNYSREVFKRMEKEISSYEFYLRHPGISNRIMNHLISDHAICQWGFHRIMKGWLSTAYHKEVEVNLD